VNWSLPGQLLTLLVGAAPLSFALAGDLPDKSRYNLFNPTPKDLLREFATDRPDKTLAQRSGTLRRSIFAPVCSIRSS